VRQTMDTTQSYIRYHRGTAAARSTGFKEGNREKLFVKKTFIPINARDALANEDTKYTLKHRGFCLVKFKASVAEKLLQVPQAIAYSQNGNARQVDAQSNLVKDQYFKETAEELKRVTGAKYCFPFTHTTRFAEKSINGNGYLATYATFAHTDLTRRAADNKDRILDFYGVDSSEHSTLDIAYFNMWQPVVNPVEQNPLALLDWQTVSRNDLVPTNLEYELDFERSRSTSPMITLLSGANSEKHAWYYYPNMVTEEALVFSQYDSREGYAERCFHTAFFDKSELVPKHPLPRKSIEVRFICFFPKHGSRL